MPGLDVVQVQLYGPVAVNIGGVDVGHTDEKGVTLAVKGQWVEAHAGKYGKASPVQKWLNGQSAEADFNLIQSVMADLSGVLPGAAVVTDLGGNKKLTFGRGAGFKMTGVPVILTPYASGMSPAFNLTMKRAIPVGDFNIVYSGDTFDLWSCKMQGLIDEATGAEGSYLFRFGDDTISADLVAPTITSVVPADNAPGVSVGAYVEWTVSKNLDLATVSRATVKLIKNPLGDPAAQAEVLGAVTLANAGAATKIRFTPTSALDAATPHLAIVEGGPSGIKDVAGNALAAMYLSDFTTA